MTRLPLEDRSVSGAEGPEYQLNLACPVPGCALPGTETHHIFRRSFLVGDYAWVQLPDGSFIGNLVRLCNQHHHMVTVNAAWIRLEEFVFTWSDMVNASQPLLWQPPWRDDDELRRSDSRDADRDPGVDDPDLRAGDVDPGFVISKPLGEKQGETDHTHHWNEDNLVSPEQLQAEGTCPTCLRPLPHRQEKTETRRERRTWSITVPKDEREDGAETLDHQLEEARQAMARAGLPYGSENAVKFFVLSQTLGLFLAHSDEILS